MGGALALAELLLVFGSVIVFGLWQLRSLRRDRRRDDVPPPEDKP